MSVLLTIIAIVLILLAFLNILLAVLLGLMYYNARQMREQVDVIFDSAVNSEEYLAAMASDKGFDFSAN
jgi:hypothetical protein